MALLHFAARQPVGRRLHDLELGDGGVAEPFDFLEPLDGRRDHLGEGAERSISSLPEA